MLVNHGSAGSSSSSGAKSSAGSRSTQGGGGGNGLTSRAGLASSAGTAASSAPASVLFRGLRVRMAMATGAVDGLKRHKVTDRIEYGGQVLRRVQALVELPEGGQVRAGLTLSVLQLIISYSCMGLKCCGVCMGMGTGHNYGQKQHTRLLIEHDGQALRRVQGACWVALTEGCQVRGR